MRKILFSLAVLAALGLASTPTMASDNSNSKDSSIFSIFGDSHHDNASEQGEHHREKAREEGEHHHDKMEHEDQEDRGEAKNGDDHEDHGDKKDSEREGDD